MRIRLWLNAFLAVMLLASTAIAEETFSYKLKDKDTLWSVARNKNTTVGKIKELNTKLLENYEKENYRNMPIGLEIKLPVKKDIKSKPAAIMPKAEEKKSDATIVETGDKKVEAKKSTEAKAEVNKSKPLPATSKKPTEGKIVTALKQIVKFVMGDWRRPAQNPFRGELLEGLSILGYSPEVSRDLQQAVRDDKFVWASISPKVFGGLVVDENGNKYVMEKMLSGGGKNQPIIVLIGKDRKQLFLDNEKDARHSEAVKIYQSGEEYLGIVRKCTNPVKLRKLPPAEAKPPVTDTPTTTTPPGVTETTTPEEPKEEEPFIYLKPTKKHLAIEHEPNIGAWIWGNDLARGDGVWGEYLAWLRKGECYVFENGWSPGLGIYGMYSEGESRISTYDWTEWGIGPQVGIKYIAGGTEKPWQWQLKLRFVFEDIEGGNAEGYGKGEDNLKLGGYTEVVKRESKDFMWGLTAEAWIGLDGEIESTWSGDVPSKRGMASVGIFGQWRLNEDWQARLSGSWFYQEWDRLLGLRFQAELRYDETYMFGPYVSLFPFGLSSVYSGISAWDLTTPGAFVRAEFQKPIRDYYAKKRIEKNRAATKEWIDKILKEEFPEEQLN